MAIGNAVIKTEVMVDIALDDIIAVNHIIKEVRQRYLETLALRAMRWREEFESQW